MDKSAADFSIYENVPLSGHTTLGVGGPARFFVKASSENHILQALDFAHAKDCPVFILGGGSNIVVSDAGFPGLAVKIEIPGIRIREGENDSTVSVGSGVEWDELVQFCVDRNLAGIECLSGIPGTVGASPIQNVGAYGEEVSEVIRDVRVLDRRSHNVLVLSNADCGFSYRSSIFKTTARDRYVILSVNLNLNPGGIPRIEYPDLQEFFDNATDMPTLSEVRNAVLEIRKEKAMVLSPEDPDSKSVGSFFINPTLTPDAIFRLEAEARTMGLLGLSEGIPSHGVSAGKEKVPAAWFVERAGFHKGHVQGRAGISNKHALALINRGGAKAQDILELMSSIQTRVKALFGVDLQPEPGFVGFDREIR